MIVKFLFMIALFRWYHKAKEAERLYQLKETVEEFDDRHQDDDVGTSGIGEDEWRLIKAYLEVVKPFMNASKLLGGDTYAGPPWSFPCWTNSWPTSKHCQGRWPGRRRGGRGRTGGMGGW